MYLTACMVVAFNFKTTGPRILTKPGRSTSGFYLTGRHRRRGEGCAYIMHVVVVLKPQTLSSLQSRDEAPRVSTDKAGIGGGRGWGVGGNDWGNLPCWGPRTPEWCALAGPGLAQ